MSDAVGVCHRDARHALGAVTLEDLGVDLGPACRLDVDVDIGQRLTQGRQEPLEQQVVPQGVYPRDAQQVRDE